MIQDIFTQSYVWISSLDTIFIVLILFVVGMFLATLLEKLVGTKITTKRQKSNLGILIHILKYAMIIVLIVFIFRTYSNPDTDYGMIFGLVSASLGFALQKPITGAAGWLIIIIKRPFYIGDRVIIGDVKGDVVDITLSHIVLHEIGGTVSSEDLSGRIIHIPTLALFQENIINYTLTDEYILDEITILITYESNLEKSEFIIQKSANQVLKAFDETHKNPPYIRLFFDNSGINIKVKYFVSAPKRHEIASDIIRLIHDGFSKEPDVEIAYPHVQIIKAATAPKKKSKKGKASKKKKYRNASL